MLKTVGTSDNTPKTGDCAKYTGINYVFGKLLPRRREKPPIMKSLQDRARLADLPKVARPHLLNDTSAMLSESGDACMQSIGASTRVSPVTR